MKGKIAINNPGRDLELTLWHQEHGHTIWTRIKLGQRAAIKLANLLIDPPKEKWHILRCKTKCFDHRAGVTCNGTKVTFGISTSVFSHEVVGISDWFFATDQLTMSRQEARKVAAFLFFWAGAYMLGTKIQTTVHKKKVLDIHGE
jgi:hypothetical protein